MTKEEIQALYRSKILPENKAPYHFEADFVSPWEVQAYNPMCGDKFKLQLVAEDDTIQEAYFHGIGCAISKASTSILMKKIEGKSEAEVSQLLGQFLAALNGGTYHFEDEELNILAALKDFEGRVDCIKLSWEALMKSLSQKNGN